MIPQQVVDAYRLGLYTSESLNTGLINATYIITKESGEKILLQKINTNVFKNPQAIQNNYLLIAQQFQAKQSFNLPQVITTSNDELLVDAGQDGVWRAFIYVPDSYSPLNATTVNEAALVAACFGKFSNDLKGLDTAKIENVLPGFHDLDWRYRQFEEALYTALPERKDKAAALIDKAHDYKHLVAYYNTISQDKENYPLHILHHDCKIANILFDTKTQQIICPVDLDTTQNGLFFSDLGDMFRSMTPSLPENAQEIEAITLRTDFYEAIKSAYLKAMDDELTPREKAEIDMSGKIIIYMQSLRFLTDYLNNDTYYKTTYPEQNYYRAANQFKLLELVAAYTA